MAKIFDGTDDVWDRLVLKHAEIDRRVFSGAFLQSSVWARVQAARGNLCVRIVDSNGAPSLWVSLPIARFLFVWFCPKGPIVLPHADEWKEIIEILQKIKHASIIRIEPRENFNLKQGQLEFKQRRDVSPAHSFLTRIESVEKMMVRFHEKTRYNIRLAGKHKVVIRKLDASGVKKYGDEILKLYQSTSGRHGIAATPASEMQSLFEVCDVWAAFFENKIVATSIQSGFGSVMTYVHGASDYESRALMAPYALHMVILQDACERGFTMYDWWGIAPEDAPATHKLAGVTRFKRGFYGEVISSFGTCDAGIDRVRFGLYTTLRRIKRP